MDLFMTDAIGPFFRGLRRHRINWSKIPFDAWEAEGAFDASRLSALCADLERVAAAAAADGFNAATLDDLFHLADHPAYDESTRRLIRSFQEAYRPLFGILLRQGLRPWITADVMSFTQATRASHGDDPARWRRLFRELVEGFFDAFPEAGGVIVRIGECDAGDVHGVFHSSLVVRTARDARELLAELLPVFERRGRTLVFRTWTVGAYPVGDLHWNRDTFRAVFDGVHSPALRISIKYGESDFFRYLATNKQFFRSAHAKIVELPARREYEGCGEYPSFIGWEYEQIRRELARAENVTGVMCWVQTGGWTVFRRLTWLDNSSPWTELNAFTVVAMFRDGLRASEAVRMWHARRGGSPDSAAHALELLRLSDEAVRELLYTEDYAARKLYFRRTRLPTALAVYWDHVLVNHAVRKLLRQFTRDPEERVRRGWAALDRVGEMRALAERAGLPAEDIDFMYHTFEILALAREYYLLPYTATVGAQLEALRAEYLARYRHRERYHVLLDFRRVRLKRIWLAGLLRLLLRRKRGYRLVDRLFTLSLLRWIHPWLLRRPGLVPEYFRGQAMGLDSVFK